MSAMLPPSGINSGAEAAGIPAADAVELEVFKHLFAAVADEMGVRLMRSAFSPNIKERRDFSCAVFDSAGQMLAQAAHIPVHLGSMPLAVEAVLARFPAAQMQPGERFVVNDPFAGGTHLPDITVVAPVILEGETLPRFFTANRAHHADIGGISPGSMPLSSSIEEEGLRIPPLRLDDAALAWICGHSRTPDERGGDLRAQLASLDAGEQRLREMALRYGAVLVEQRGRELLDYTERIMRAVLAGLPGGTYRFTDVLDGDGFDAEGIAICCQLELTGGGSVLRFQRLGRPGARPGQRRARHHCLGGELRPALPDVRRRAEQRGTDAAGDASARVRAASPTRCRQLPSPRATWRPASASWTWCWARWPRRCLALSPPRPAAR